MLSIIVTIFLNLCKVCFIIGVLMIFLVPKHFVEFNLKPFWKRHKIISVTFIVMCVIGLASNIYYWLWFFVSKRYLAVSMWVAA